MTGVHVGQSDLPCGRRTRTDRRARGSGPECSHPDQLRAAAADPARVHHVGIGALHATRTKTDAPAPLGHAGFARLARLSDLPTVAIGGITPADLPRLRDAGAVGAAAVSGICAAADPRASARAYARAWDRAREERYA